MMKDFPPPGDGRARIQGLVSNPETGRDWSSEFGLEHLSAQWRRAQ